jgi:hypothetical protein
MGFKANLLTTLRLSKNHATIEKYPKMAKSQEKLQSPILMAVHEIHSTEDTFLETGPQSHPSITDAAASQPLYCEAQWYSDDPALLYICQTNSSYVKIPRDKKIKSTLARKRESLIAKARRKVMRQRDAEEKDRLKEKKAVKETVKAQEDGQTRVSFLGFLMGDHLKCL